MHSFLPTKQRTIFWLCSLGGFVLCIVVSFILWAKPWVVDTGFVVESNSSMSLADYVSLVNICLTYIILSLPLLERRSIIISHLSFLLSMLALHGIYAAFGSIVRASSINAIFATPFFYLGMWWLYLLRLIFARSETWKSGLLLGILTAGFIPLLFFVLDSVGW